MAEEIAIQIGADMGRAEQAVESFVRKTSTRTAKIGVDAGGSMFNPQPTSAAGMGAVSDPSYRAVGPVASGMSAGDLWRANRAASGPATIDDMDAAGGPVGRRQFSSSFAGRGWGRIGAGALLGHTAFGIANATREGRIDEMLAGGDSVAQYEGVMKQRERIAAAGGWIGAAVSYLEDPTGEREAGGRAGMNLARATVARSEAAGRTRDFVEGIVRKNYVEGGVGDIEQRRRAAEVAHAERLEQIGKEKSKQEEANQDYLRKFKADQEASFDIRRDQAIKSGRLSAGYSTAGVGPGGSGSYDYSAANAALGEEDAAALAKARSTIAQRAQDKFGTATAEAQKELDLALAAVGRSERAIDIARRDRFAGDLSEAGALDLEARGDARGAQRARLNAGIASERAGLARRFSAGDSDVGLSDFAGQFVRGFMQRINQEAGFSREDDIAGRMSIARQGGFVARRQGDDYAELAASQRARRIERIGNLLEGEPRRVRIESELGEQEKTEYEELGRGRYQRSEGLRDQRDVSALEAGGRFRQADVEAVLRKGVRSAEELGRTNPDDARAELEITRNQVEAMRYRLTMFGHGEEAPAGTFGPTGTAYGGNQNEDESGLLGKMDDVLEALKQLISIQGDTGRVIDSAMGNGANDFG